MSVRESVGLLKAIVMGVCTAVAIIAVMQPGSASRGMPIWQMPEALTLYADGTLELEAHLTADDVWTHGDGTLMRFLCGPAPRSASPNALDWPFWMAFQGGSLALSPDGRWEIVGTVSAETQARWRALAEALTRYCWTRTPHTRWPAKES